MFDTITILTLLILLVGVLALFYAVYTRVVPPIRERIEATQKAFIETRKYLRDRSSHLVEVAYRYAVKKNKDLTTSIQCEIAGSVFKSPVLARTEWIPPNPTSERTLRLLKSSDWDSDLQSVQTSEWDKQSGLKGSIRTFEYLWPLNSSGKRYTRYSDCISDIDPQRLWWNEGMSYRLMSIVRQSGQNMELEFRLGKYFDHFDTGESLFFELAKAHLSSREWSDDRRHFSKLKARKKLGDPLRFDLRCAEPGIVTLTLFQDAEGGFRFVMHERDPLSVALAGKLIHVIPAGEFEPSSTSLSTCDQDLSIWKNVMREYDEELFNPSPGAGNIQYPTNWEANPRFAAMNSARESGDIRMFFLGIVMNPADLKPDILTACVFSKAAFDHLLPNKYDEDEEGRILWKHGEEGLEGVKFDGKGVSFYLGREDLYPTARACLIQAWNNRGVLLGS